MTFLFTDVVGSTPRWRRDEAAMSTAMQDHDDTLRSVVDGAGGVVFKHTGDGVIAAFSSPLAAVEAALAAQEQLGLPARMGVHTGEAELRDGDYFGTTLNKGARIVDAGHGGQILLSEATAALVSGVDAIELGRFEMKGLEESERLFQVGNSDFPALRARAVVAGNLPRTPTEFIGRGTDLDRVVEGIASQQVVTLFGVGGTGKTRLAIEAGRRVAPSMDRGCWFVDLAEASSGDALPITIANGVGVRPAERGDVLDDIARRLGDSTILVIVDNCEHLLDAAATAVERLSDACGGLHVLATSREPLVMPGEHVIPVGALGADDAVSLFLARATAEAPDLVFDDTQLTAIGELCRRLDGLPLAIELAAARVRSLTPVDLLDGMDERFRLLTRNRRSRSERHQTMQATLDWSYELCDAIEQAVFDELSVFPTGFDLDAAITVTREGTLSRYEGADVVGRLVDRSLLHATSGLSGGTQYRMLETIRAYGRQHLDGTGRIEQVRNRHAHWVSQRIDHLALTVLGPDEASIFAEIAELLPDVIVAFNRYLDHQHWDAALALLPAYQFPAGRAYGELVNQLHRELSQVDPHHPLLDELQATQTVTGRSRPTAEDINALAWASLDAPHVINHRDSYPPAILLNDGPRDLADHELERIAAFGRIYAHARPLTHMRVHYSLARCFTKNERHDLTNEIADVMERHAEHLNSNLYRSLALESRSNLDRVDRNWNSSADRLAQARRLRVSSIGTDIEFHTLMMDFEELEARAHTGSPQPHALVEPWERLVQLRAWIALHRATLITASVLHEAGHTDLAQTFVASAYHFDRSGMHAGAMKSLRLRHMWSDYFEFEEDPNAEILPLDELIERLRQLRVKPANP